MLRFRRAVASSWHLKDIQNSEDFEKSTVTGSSLPSRHGSSVLRQRQLVAVMQERQNEIGHMATGKSVPVDTVFLSEGQSSVESEPVEVAYDIQHTDA